MTFKVKTSPQDICKEFTLLYLSFLIYSAIKNDPKKIFSFGDCDFLNYWLNDKLRKSVKDGDNIDVRGFYDEIKNKNQDLFSHNEDLVHYMNNIDPEILKNMELLYDLYDNDRKILNILFDPDHTDPKNKECPVYRDHCLKKYVEAINRCYGIYDEFYKALKDFKSSYNYTIVQGNEDRYNCRGDTEYKLNDYDPVLEREKTKIMLIQGSTSFLMLILTFPLIYKFTPFGPFLQGKIKKVKNMWKSPKKNKEKLLSSMDIGNNISDNIKYKLAYNSVTNE
ncbi:Plasmodium vivax Vir protein, putative [Plasmodium vivax]|uniref:Vir protein, putative n=1 Tax=Plasmodium vivax TaxID=5855 RepID=A0A1G4ED23_PLAVI|nr:Plasmodium vivax Vir protein, putative [Plasmodium vivax]